MFLNVKTVISWVGLMNKYVFKKHLLDLGTKISLTVNELHAPKSLECNLLCPFQWTLESFASANCCVLRTHLL